MGRRPWWYDGVQFQCQGSGKCCVSHGEFGCVYLTKEDRKNLAAKLKLSVMEFVKQYCVRSDGGYRLRDLPDLDNCVFLQDKSCGVYEARPIQCRTWPFWPDVMGAKAWARDVEAFCPGVGWNIQGIQEELGAFDTENLRSGFSHVSQVPGPDAYISVHRG